MEKKLNPKWKENTLCPFSVTGGLVTRSKAFQIGSVSEWLETLPPESTKTGETLIMREQENHTFRKYVGPGTNYPGTLVQCCQAAPPVGLIESVFKLVLTGKGRLCPYLINIATHHPFRSFIS